MLDAADTTPAGDESTPIVAGVAMPAATPPGTLSSTWYCAGGTATADGFADHVVIIANPTGEVRRAVRVRAHRGLRRAPGRAGHVRELDHHHGSPGHHRDHRTTAGAHDGGGAGPQPDRGAAPGDRGGPAGVGDRRDRRAASWRSSTRSPPWRKAAGGPLPLAPPPHRRRGPSHGGSPSAAPGSSSCS